MGYVVYILAAMSITATNTSGVGSYERRMSSLTFAPNVRYPNEAVPVYVTTQISMAIRTVLENSFRVLVCMQE